ncbi:hypothetical protein PHMEG_00013746 [Phytophthora megakarya]|uniref:Uncharacterized protein n=1 Tax=Phytophthora megakarya TaxID=4795 RepID=A0A225W719_9STRA|nr:hypothetical protein PHMEG_00013746 [Phytophthora megakarya]
MPDFRRSCKRNYFKSLRLILSKRAHKLIEFSEWTQVREGVQKRPQYQCNVGSIRKGNVGRRSVTRFFYETCSDGNNRVYLGDCVRPQHYPGNNVTCHQIWHISGRTMGAPGKKHRSAVARDGDQVGNADHAEEEKDAEEEGDGSVTAPETVGEKDAKTGMLSAVGAEAQGVRL